MAKNQDVEELFGTTQEEIEQSAEIVPTLDLANILDKPEDNIVFEFVDDVPREIEFEKDGEQVKARVMTVRFMGTDYTLWLSAKSLRTPIANLYQKHGGLKGVQVRVSKTEGNHKKYGKTTYYRVQEVEDSFEE